MIEVFENYLDNDKCNKFTELLEDCEIPLFFSNTTTGIEQENESPQFTHLFYQNKEPSFLLETFYKVFDRLVELKTHELIRAKLNLQTAYRKHLIHPFHTDGDPGDISFLYYLNDSDGPTVFKLKGRDKKIKPVRNRLIRFPADLPHASSTPYVSRYRAIINIVVRPKL